MASHDPDFTNAHASPGEGATPPDVEPRRRGCLFYGCVAAAVLAVLTMIGLALAAWVSYRTIVRYRDMYTSAAPAKLPELSTSKAERQRAVARVEAFRVAVEGGKASEPLVLSGDDLNALIRESPKLRDRVFLSIIDDRIKAELSVPLFELQDFSLTRGRYLNGEAEVKVELEDGRLTLEILSMRAEGKELPSMICDLLTHSDFVVDADDEDHDDTEEERRFKRFLTRLESLEVEDGKIVVTPRPPE